MIELAIAFGVGLVVGVSAVSALLGSSISRLRTERDDAQASIRRMSPDHGLYALDRMCHAARNGNLWDIAQVQIFYQNEHGVADYSEMIAHAMEIKERLDSQTSMSIDEWSDFEKLVKRFADTIGNPHTSYKHSKILEELSLNEDETLSQGFKRLQAQCEKTLVKYIRDVLEYSVFDITSDRISYDLWHDTFAVAE